MIYININILQQYYPAWSALNAMQTYPTPAVMCA